MQIEVCDKCGEPINAMGIKVADEAMFAGGKSELCLILPNDKTHYVVRDVILAKALRKLIVPEIPQWKKECACELREVHSGTDATFDNFDCWSDEEKEQWLRVVEMVHNETKKMIVQFKTMRNGYRHFVCPTCGHDNPIVFSDSMQQLADMSDTFNCESCGQLCGSAENAD